MAQNRSQAPLTVTYNVDTGLIEEWDMPVGNPHHHPPCVLFMAADVIKAMDHGTTVHWNNGDSMTITPSLKATVTTPDNRTLIYILNPVRWSDGERLPSCFVGRWPD